MKKYILLYIGLFSIVMSVSAQLSVIDNNSPSITRDISQIVDTSSIDNPLRDGAYLGVSSPDGQHELDIINIGKIVNFAQAQNQTLSLLQNIINYALSFLALIVFAYLIYEGYKIVVAGSDEEAYKSAITKLKNSAIAIAGIALSWFIVSFIFYVLDTVI